jgi:TRAP-type C4-dicarboxylate transport system permease small subunit
MGIGVGRRARRARRRPLIQERIQSPDNEQGNDILLKKPEAAGSGVYARLRRALDLVDGALVAVGSLMLFMLMCLVVADVSMRYFFNAPLQWSYEVVSSYLMPGLFFLAVSHTLRAHSHVAVDIVHNYVGRNTRYTFEALASLLAAPAFTVCAWMAAGVTIEDFRTAATSTSGLAVPTWTVSIFLPLGFGLLSVRLFLNALGYLLSLGTGRDVLALPPISGTEGAE